MKDKAKKDAAKTAIKVTETNIRFSKVEFSRDSVMRAMIETAKQTCQFDIIQQFEKEEVQFHKNGSITVVLTNPQSLPIVVPKKFD